MIPCLKKRYGLFFWKCKHKIKISKYRRSIPSKTKFMAIFLYSELFHKTNLRAYFAFSTRLITPDQCKECIHVGYTKNASTVFYFIHITSFAGIFPSLKLIEKQASHSIWESHSLQFISGAVHSSETRGQFSPSNFSWSFTHAGGTQAEGLEEGKQTAVYEEDGDGW